MPQVASETKSHAVKFTQPNVARATASNERASASPFEAMLDENAAANADRLARDSNSTRSNRSQNAPAPAKSTPDKAERPAAQADNRSEAPDNIADKEAKAEKSGGTDVGAGKETKETKKTEESKASKESKESAPGEAKSEEAKEAAPATGAVDAAGAIVAVETAVQPEAVPADADAEGAAKPAAAVAVEAATATKEPALAGAAAAAEAEPVNLPRVEAKADKATDEKDGETAALETLAAKDAKPQAPVDKPQQAAAAEPDKDETAHARGEARAHAERGHADTAANHADTQPGSDKPAVQNAQPQGVPAPAHTVNPAMATNAASAAAPAQAARQEQPVPVSGVAVEIASKAVAGKNRFEIRLDPPELGRIDVRLDVDRHGHVTSRLVVDRAETLDLLRRDASGLERALQDAGLKTSDNGLQFSLRDQTADRRQEHSSGEHARLIVEDETMPVAETTARSYGYLSGRSSGLDIRV